MKKKYFITIILTIFLTGCYFSSGIKAGDKAVAKFHEQLNNEEFAHIFDQSGVEFRETYDRQKIIDTFKHIRENLGKVESTTRLGWTVKNNSFGLIAIINSDTKFEKGSAKERFVFLIVDDQKVELTDYEFGSEDIDLP